MRVMEVKKGATSGVLFSSAKSTEEIEVALARNSEFRVKLDGISDPGVREIMLETEQMLVHGCAREIFLMKGEMEHGAMGESKGNYEKDVAAALKRLRLSLTRFSAVSHIVMQETIATFGLKAVGGEPADPVSTFANIMAEDIILMSLLRDGQFGE